MMLRFSKKIFFLIAFFSFPLPSPRLHCQGFTTNYVVEATARHASDDDYKLIILDDCCSSMNQEVHDFSMQSILPNLGPISTSDEIVGML